MKKIILTTLAILVALPLIAAGVVLAVNWQDEPLQPEVDKILNWQPPAHAFEGNGYFILSGINAPADQDPAELGRSIFENNIKSYLSSRGSFDPHSNPDKPNEFSLRDLKTATCDYAETKNCVEFYLQSDKGKLSSLLSSKKLLIDRVLAIQNSPNYVEIYIPSVKFELPHYEYLVFISELRRIQSIEEIKEGNIERGVSQFVRNAQFSRWFLSNSSTLIPHLIALAMVNRDMRILSELMEKYPRIASFKNELLPVLTPISGDEYSMKNAIGSERDITLNIFNDVKENIGRDRPALTFKPNATLNLAYQIGTARTDIAGASANRVDEALHAFDKKRKAMMGFSIFGFYFYNPAGKMLLDADELSYIAYAERHHDTDGYIRLVATQAKLISENIPTDKIAEALKNTGPDLRNPYTGQPMQWDSVRRRLRFAGRQPSKQVPGKGNVYEVQLPVET